MKIERLLGMGMLVLAMACASTSTNTGPAPAAPPASLYNRLGQRPAIDAVVHDFVGRLAADERIKARFANTDMARLERLLAEQICAATGGPCVYTGRDMKVTHVGMNISEAEFGALVADLKASLDTFRVPAREQNELLTALGGMRPDIVEGSRTPAGGATAGPADAAVGEKAQGLREAAGLLDKAGAARGRGNRSLAEQLFSAAELIVGPEVLAPIAAAFREGAPPRVATPLSTLPLDTPPQPAAVGSSDEDEPEPKPLRGQLRGSVAVPGSAGRTAVVVVTLTPVSAHARKRAPRHRIVEQRGRQFAPRVLVVPVGSTVAFPNFDAVYHNVFSRSETKPFDLGIYKGGQSRELVFDKEGLVRIGCNLHANMSAFVVVADAPHYAITDEQGGFFFRSLAPGKYRLRAYSDRRRTPHEQMVQVDATSPGRAEAAPLRIELAPETPPGPATDKFGEPRVATSP